MKIITEEKHFEVQARTSADKDRKNYGKHISGFTLPDEWNETDVRHEEEGWKFRYVYEPKVILDIIDQINAKNILEIGSGVGKLSYEIFLGDKNNIIQEYHLIDSPLKTPFSPKLISEMSLPDEMVTSWNWYFAFRPLPE